MVIIADTHIRSKACQARLLLETLRELDFPILVIAGDLTEDDRREPGDVMMNRHQFLLIEYLRDLVSKKGGKKTIVRLAGNHDPYGYDFINRVLGIRTLKEYRWVMNGRKYCAIHGHQFDRLMFRNPILSKAISGNFLLLQRFDTRGRHMTRLLDHFHNRWLRLAETIKAGATQYALDEGLDVIVTGHVHEAIRPSVEEFGKPGEYWCCGDWTGKNCAYIVIDMEGKMELLELTAPLKHEFDVPSDDKETTATTAPHLSIIIPTLNEEETLPRLLKTIKEQTYRDFEVIVADSPKTTDKTREIAHEAGCRIVNGGTVSEGRNNGAAAALGEVFLFLDADVTLPNCFFLEDTIRELSSRGLDLATCRIHAIDGGGYDRLFHRIYNVYSVALARVLPHIPGFCFFVKRPVFEEAGGFDPEITLAEDHELARRGAKIGTYGILSSQYISVSTRRFKRDGMLATAAKYILCELHMLIFGPVKSNIFKYGWGYNKTGTDSASKNKE
jgi:UDP-2,3-diacylglucosamine pyrophosphatase LpxH